MKQTELRLKGKDRAALEAFRAKGEHHAREINRAHILLGLDKGITEKGLQEVLGVGRTAVWRTRAAYHEGGWEHAVRDLPRPGQPRRYRAEEEAEVTALACSAAPQGRKRWTVRLLTAAAQQRPKLEAVSRETIRRILKKTSSNPGEK
jgi:transposase